MFYKLHDRHRRLSALEQEILRLKPLLLMQPYSTSLLKQSIASQHQSTKVHDKGKRRDVDPTPSKTGMLDSIPEENNDYHSHSPKKFDADSYPYGYQYKPEESSSSTLLSSSVPPQNSFPFLFEGPSAPSPSSQRRKSKDHSSNNKSKKQKQQRVTSISSDAYTEHVLLAAQKIGRKRAAYVTGLQKLADREKELLVREQEQILSKKEQERLEKERLERLASGTSSTAYYRASSSTSPRRGASRSGSTASSLKTPKRGGHPTFGVGTTNNANPGGVNTPTPSNYVFVNTVTPLSKCAAGHSPGTITTTPSRAPVVLGSGMRSTHVNLPSNPPTPLDSLVDAARMMGENGDSPIGRRRPLEEPESPTAKRRRVSTDKPVVNRSTSRFGRVKSALDVLADQAAAVNEPGPAAMVQPGGKGKSRARGQDTQPISTSTRSRGRAKSARLPTHRRSESPTGTSSTGRGLAKAVQGRQSRSAVPGPRVIARPSATPSQYPFASPKVARVGPVVGWGNRPDLDDEDEEDEDEEEEDSDSQSISIPHDGYDNQYTGPEEQDLRTRGVDDFAGPHARLFEAEGNVEQATVAPETTKIHPRTSLVMNDGPSTESAARTTLQELPSQESTRPQSPSFSRHISRDRSQEHVPATHSSSNQLVTPKSDHQVDHNEEGAGPDDDIQAEHDEDEDAEGEEEGTESEAEVGTRAPPSRSRSPPPPDPPPPGSDGGTGPDEGHDPDADAEGEMDVDDNGTPGGSAMISSLYQSRTGHQKDVLVFLEVLHCSFRVVPANICYFMPAIYSMIQLLTLSNHCLPFVSTISHDLAISCTMPWRTHKFEEGIESLRSGLREGDSHISYAVCNSEPFVNHSPFCSHSS